MCLLDGWGREGGGRQRAGGEGRRGAGEVGVAAWQAFPTERGAVHAADPALRPAACGSLRRTFQRHVQSWHSHAGMCRDAMQHAAHTEDTYLPAQQWQNPATHLPRIWHELKQGDLSRQFSMVKPYLVHTSAMLGGMSEQSGPVKCRGQSHLRVWSGRVCRVASDCRSLEDTSPFGTRHVHATCRAAGGGVCSALYSQSPAQGRSELRAL